MNVALVSIIIFKLQLAVETSNGTFNGCSPSCESCDNRSSCPSWSYCSNNNTCECYDRNDVVLCSEDMKEGGILQCYCITWNKKLNDTEEGNCVYNCKIYHRNYFSLNGTYTTLPRNLTDLNVQMCSGLNRTGTLCSECVDGMYMRAYSYDMSCTTCSGGWINILKYILVAFVPLIMLYLIILYCRINIPSSNLQGFVLACQMATSPMILRVFITEFTTRRKPKTYTVFQVFGTIFGIWNLDFFRLIDLDICFRIAPLTVLSLDILIALFPFILILVTWLIILLHHHNFKAVHLMCKVPIHLAKKCGCSNNSKDIKTSTIDAFVTFMLLSYVKLFNVCLDIMVPVTIHRVKNKNDIALFMDASLSYFGYSHLFYTIPSLLIGLVFIVGPVATLFLYSYTFFQKGLNILPHRWQIFIRLIVDSLQGRYKDGTEPGTRDCRWFSTVPFILRFVFIIMISFTFNTAMLPYITQVFTIAAIITILTDPFKHNFKQMTSYFAFYLLLLANIYMPLIGMDYSYISISMPGELNFIVFTIITVFAGIIYSTVLCIIWILNYRK